MSHYKNFTNFAPQLKLKILSVITAMFINKKIWLAKQNHLRGQLTTMAVTVIGQYSEDDFPLMSEKIVNERAKTPNTYPKIYIQTNF